MKTKKTTKTTAAEEAMTAEAPRSETTAQLRIRETVTIPEDIRNTNERRAYAGALRAGRAGTHLAFVHLPLMPVLACGWLEGDRQRTEARMVGEVIADMLTAPEPDAADVAEHEAARA